MKVGSQLEQAQLEHITSADEATAGKQVGRVYYNTDTDEVLIGTGSSFRRVGASASSIGEIRYSMLTEAQFQAEMGSVVGAGGHHTWKLANGDNVFGSDYATLTGNTNLVDLRGMFVRGKNNGRSDGAENPDGDLPLGQYTPDKVDGSGLTTDTAGSHNHVQRTNANQQLMFGGISGGPYQSRTDAGPRSGGTFITTTSNGDHTHTLSGGDNQTAPRNYTVNIFIKVNRI